MSDSKQELAAVITARYSSFDALSALGIATAIVEAGWVSPEEHHETLNDYGQAVGDLNLANYRLSRVEALAEELEAADSGSNAADYRLARFIVGEIRTALAAGGSADLGT